MTSKTAFPVNEEPKQTLFDERGNTNIILNIAGKQIRFSVKDISNETLKKTEETIKKRPQDIHSVKEAQDFLTSNNDKTPLPSFQAKANVFNKLITLAAAWNKADNFYPSPDEPFYSPIFLFLKEIGRYEPIALSSCFDTPADEQVVVEIPCLSFQSPELAYDFSRQFVSLFNQLLLNTPAK